MDRKGLELAISTLVVIVLGVLLLIGLIYIVTDGFKSFKGAIKPFEQTTEASSVREACRIACASEDRMSYCCRNFTVSEENVKCFDTRLEVGCDLSCEGFSCS